MSSILQILKSKDLREYIEGVYKDDFERFSDGTYRSICNIHGGDNPSTFTIYPDNSYYCFSCLTHGNIVNYVMERENVSFAKAIDILCENYSIDINRDESYVKQISIAERNEKYCNIYEKNLNTCIEYLKQKRGLTEKTIKDFRLGYASESKAITIPMLNEFGQIVSFGYRFFEGKVKYKNGKNNELFQKGSYLYNIDKAIKIVRKTKKLYIVEGHFDAIAATQMGEACVAYCGIAFSQHHVKLIKEFTKRIDGVKIIIIPDNDDKAGKFVQRGRELFQKFYKECSVKVVEINDDKIKDYNDILLSGKTISDFPIYDIDIFVAKQLLEQYPDDKQAQRKAIEKYARTIDDPIVKADLAETLSKIWDKPLDVIKEFLNITVNSDDETMGDISNIIDCFKELDLSLNEEEITFGYPMLDNNITMRKKWVTVLGAYSFSGKTNMVIDWILHWCIRLQKKVMFFSLEMPKSDLLEIIIAKVMQIPEYTVRDYIRSPQGKKVFQDITEKLNNYLYIVDKNGISIDDVNNYIKLYNSKNQEQPLDIVAIDYFGYLKNTATFEEQATTAKSMKEIAKEYNISFVMLSQFTKDSQRGDKGKFREPILGDLKGAGDIGASADIVILIWRPYNADTSLSEIDREKIKYLTCLKVAKARKGLRQGISHYKLWYNINTSQLGENEI